MEVQAQNEPETETNPLVLKVLESKEFKKAVEKIVQGMNIDADSIEGLEGAVESVIDGGTFEADTEVSFRA